MAKFCSGCGKELEDDEVFCTKCGTKCGPSEPVNTGGNSSFQNVMVTADGKKKIIAVVLGIAVILLCVVMFSSGGSDNSRSNVATVKAEEMMDDYIRDQGTAESKYKDKNLNVTGMVLHKGQFKNSNNFSLTLAAQNAAGRSYRIEIDIPADKVEIVNKAEEGKYISVQGTCVGIVKQDNPTTVSVQIKADKINQ